MRWDERQRAMLEAMGIRLWPTGGVAPVAEALTRAEPAAVAGDRPDAEGAARTGAAVASPRVEAGGGLPDRAPGPTDRLEMTSPGERRSGSADARPRERPAGHALASPHDRRDAAAVSPPRMQPAEAAMVSRHEPPAEATFASPGGRSDEMTASALPHPDDVLDGAALAALAAVCTACALCAGRTRAVLGRLDAEADWLVVGDAPDAEDDRAGQPFTGAAGRLLDNMLAAVDLTRDAGPRERRAALTHAVKCRPPAQRMPEASELARCSVYLEREIALVRPRVILAMGRHAAQALLGTPEPGLRLRGRVHRHASGAAVVVTASPASLLRHPEAKADAWHDLCLALEATRTVGA